MLFEQANANAQSDMASPLVTAGRAAIAGEASALWDLARALDDRFADAVQLLLGTADRVVVTGLGKSGHIARKLTATLNATGTPSSFLHAADALHGDIGELKAGDTVLILSNSGETPECCAVADRARALKLPVIAITSRADSALGLIASVTLPLPHAVEICPLELSPTTSSTMMLALGDALAVVAMRERGFTLDSVRQLHPAGRIGRDLVPVARFMHGREALPFVTHNASMAAVLATMSDKGFGIAIVVADDRHRLIGVITDGDVRRHAHNLATATAADILTAEPRSIRSDATARDALTRLRECRITALVVVDAAAPQEVTGLVHIHDFLGLGVS